MKESKIAELPCVVSAYLSRTGQFLAVETKAGNVFHIWEKDGGYEMIAPIKPNLKTGSSLWVHDGILSHEDLKEVLESESRTSFPNFFSHEDKEVTQFLNLAQSVEIHGNIFGFEKIK